MSVAPAFKEMNGVYYTMFATPLWEIVLAGDCSGLTRLHLGTDEGRRGLAIEETWVRDDGFFASAREQILEYLAEKRRTFSLPLNPGGTVFQNRVWKALCAIPYGEVRTYKEVAMKVGNPNASRAVGMANAKNPLPIIIPCHRVIGSNASLTGFAFGLEAKQRLLDLERGR